MQSDGSAPTERPVSPSELGVLTDAADGMTVLESARRRAKGAETVKTQRRKILVKLGARNMTQAVAVAIREGLIESPRERRSIS